MSTISVKECSDDTDVGIAPIIELLCAHAALVQNTSDHMALTLSDGASELEELSASLPRDAQLQFQKSVSRMLVALQSQDILRQQVGVLMHGLKALSTAEPPTGTGQRGSDWISSQISGLRDAYVMREQYVLHATLTGTPAPPLEVDMGPLLFD